MTMRLQQDEAAAAYEAITAQLAEWGDGDGAAAADDVRGASFPSRRAEGQRQRGDGDGGGGGGSAGGGGVAAMDEGDDGALMSGGSEAAGGEEYREEDEDGRCRYRYRYRYTYSPPRSVSKSKDEHDGYGYGYVGNEEYLVNAAYHDAVQRYLVQRNDVTFRVVPTTQHHQQEQEGDDNDESSRRRRIEAELLQSLFNVCHARAFRRSDINSSGNSSGVSSSSVWSTAEREANLWKLMQVLLRHHLNGVRCLLFDPPGSGSGSLSGSGNGDNTSVSGGTCTGAQAPPSWDWDAIDPNVYPRQLVNGVLAAGNNYNYNNNNDVMSFLVQRRHLVVRWMEGCFSRHVDGTQSLVVPPRHRNVMWQNTLNNVQRRPVMLDPDAPLRTSSSAKHQQLLLDPTDEQHDAELLRAVLVCIQCGNMDEARNVCVRAGQSWRAAALRGGELHGLAIMPDENVGNSDDDDDDDDDHDHGGPRQIGNPHRMLWKKQCQLLGQKLSTLSDSRGLQQQSTHKHRDAFLYESAIYALLSHDVPRAVHNPLLQSWEHHVWIYFRAMVECALDQLLELHAQKRLDVGKRLPYPGTDVDGMQHDYVNVLHTLTSEAVVFNTLATPPTSEKIRVESTDVVRMAMSSVIMGRRYITEYLVGYIHGRVVAGNNNDDDPLSNELLRFATHLMIYLGITYPSELDLPEHAMLDVVRAYIDSLITQRHLPLVALYTSLLPTQLLVETYVKFLIDVEDDADRQLTLKLARDAFSEGLDLVILRKVVETILDEPTNVANGRMVNVGMIDNNDGTVGDDEEGGGGTTASSGSTTRKVVTVHSSDLRKLLSIQWLCYHPEHRLNGLVHANALLRQLLLSSDGDNGAGTGGLGTSAPGAGSKLAACKLFVMRFFPPDSIDVVREYCLSSTEQPTSSTSEEEDRDMVRAAAEDAIVEHIALCTFLEAHTAYEQWGDVMVTCEKNIPTTRPGTAAGETAAAGVLTAAESEILYRHEFRKYKHDMRSLARTAIRATEGVEEKLRNVLQFRGGGGGGGGRGWLGEPLVGGQDHEDWAGRNRREELVAVRKLCLPQTVHMLYSVLDGMASFTDVSFAGMDVQDRSEIFPPNGVVVDTVLLGPKYWHRRAMALANLVASDEHGLPDVMDGGEVRDFLSCMAESAVKLLRCDE